MTFSQYYNVWAQEMETYGHKDFRSRLPYSAFIQAWYAFMKLLQIDWEDGMKCEVCGPSPRIVICDGTSLGFQKKFLSILSEACPIEKIVVPRYR